MAHFVEAVTRAGAKLVLVGDPEQLQPIEAGAAFRSIVERIGYAELETIYRQKEAWMRAASLDLARGRIEQAISTYASQGRVNGTNLKAEAITSLIADWDRTYNPEKSTLKRLIADEAGLRQRASIDIPALSPAAETVLAKVRDAIDRNDLPAALGFALADRMVKAEIDALNAALRQRFGERALLGNGAMDTGGPAFKAASTGLTPAEQQKLALAWPTMRTAQQLAAHERTVEALKQTEALRQTQRQSQVLK